MDKFSLSIAQLAERWTVAVSVNPSVTGSIPVRETDEFISLFCRGGLVGYDAALTQLRSGVRFPSTVLDTFYYSYYCHRPCLLELLLPTVGLIVAWFIHIFLLGRACGLLIPVYCHRFVGLGAWLMMIAFDGLLMRSALIIFSQSWVSVVWASRLTFQSNNLDFSSHATTQSNMLRHQGSNSSRSLLLQKSRNKICCHENHVFYLSLTFVASPWNRATKYYVLTKIIL